MSSRSVEGPRGLSSPGPLEEVASWSSRTTTWDEGFFVGALGLEAPGLEVESARRELGFGLTRRFLEDVDIREKKNVSV